MKRQILLFVFMSTLLYSCTKQSTSKDKNDLNQTSRIPNTYSRQTVDDSIASRLISTYGLVVLTPQQIGNLTLPTFNNYDSASTYCTLMIQHWNQTISGSGAIYHGGGGVFRQDCTGADTYHSSLSGSGGFFSGFDAYITTTGFGISGVSLYVTGLPLFWSWNQIGNSFAGYQGCVYGTITWGIQVGNLTLGLIQNYHFNMSMDANNCLLYHSQGPGGC